MCFMSVVCVCVSGRDVRPAADGHLRCQLVRLPHGYHRMCHHCLDLWYGPVEFDLGCAVVGVFFCLVSSVSCGSKQLCCDGVCAYTF